MQGKKPAAAPKLFAMACVESLVPEDDYYRKLEKAVDFSFIEELARPYYAKRGRPSIDPVVLSKIALIGYLEGISFERQLMRQIQVNLSFRRFIGYEIDEEIPDHSTLSKARDRFDLEFYYAAFSGIVRQCNEASLIGWGEAGADATLIEANAAMDSLERKHPSGSPQEYLRIALAGEPKPKASNKTHQSRTDKDAKIARRGKGKAFLAYLGHRIVDATKRVIVTVSTTTADISEGRELKGLLESCASLYGKLPDLIAADKRYGTGANLRTLAEIGIEAHIPVQEHPNQKGLLSRESFEYQEEADCYVCPEGKVLRKIKSLKKERVSQYRAKAQDCRECPRRRECCSSENGRIVSRSMDEEYVLAARERAASPAGRKAARMRRSTVEWSFAEGKMYHNLRRAQWRGLRKVAIQNLLEATAQNVKRLVEAHDMRDKAAAAAAARQLLHTLEAANILYSRLLAGTWHLVGKFLPRKALPALAMSFYDWK
jgi:transposase